MAPVTRSQAAPAQAPAAPTTASRSHSEESPGSVDFTLLLPTELTASILEQLLPDYADVARASVVCKRIASLAVSEAGPKQPWLGRATTAAPNQRSRAPLQGQPRAAGQGAHALGHRAPAAPEGGACWR